MPNIETVLHDLRAMGTGVQKARAATAAADHTAQEITAQATRAGFTGIAVGMRQIREIIAEVGQRLAGIDTAVNGATAALAAAPQEMTPQQTIAVLSPQAQALTEVRTQLSGAIDRVDQTRQVTNSVLRGGQPGPMLTALGTIIEILCLLARSTAPAGQNIAAVIAAAEHVGAAGK